MDEDDLGDVEKTKILQELCSEKLPIFLTRYQKYFLPEDCQYFPETEDPTVKTIVKQISGKVELTEKEFQKRNRRFNAMQTLLKDGVFFSDLKMREREPYLFDAMIGKFLNAEDYMEHLRPTTTRDPAECTWSTLLDRFEDSTEIADRRNLQEMKWEGPRMNDGGRDHISRFMGHVASRMDDFVPEEEEEDDDENEKEEVPEAGVSGTDVEDDIEKMRKEMERLASMEEAEQYNLLGEDDTPLVLRQEFEAFMQQKFLAGKDTEFYDYSLCESETSADPIRERDDEEKWFDDDDD
uniref:DUF2052 domain-containing protein n=1 Tax=Caenorhabditis japonica TaxID=281687 RepID=A0A8R1DUU4_CAEJA